MVNEEDRMTLISRISSTKEHIEISADMGSLEEVLETVERFLRVSGYNPEGRLSFVKED